MKNSLELKCPKCKKITKHYVSKNGECRCLICGGVSKTIVPKIKEVIFESDESFNNMLNKD